MGKVLAGGHGLGGVRPGMIIKRRGQNPAAFLHSAVGEAQDADDDEVHGHDVVQEPGHDKDQDSGQQRDDGLQGDIGHGLFLWRAARRLRAGQPGGEARLTCLIQLCMRVWGGTQILNGKAGDNPGAVMVS